MSGRLSVVCPGPTESPPGHDAEGVPPVVRAAANVVDRRRRGRYPFAESLDDRVGQLPSRRPEPGLVESVGKEPLGRAGPNRRGSGRTDAGTDRTPFRMQREAEGA